MSDFVSFAVSVCPFCCLEWLVFRIWRLFWLWRLFWCWVQHRMVVLCTDLVGQWQKFIHYKHVSDYHKFDWCLPWAFSEACFLFLIITNIGYSDILLPLFKSAYSELFYLSEHIRFRMHYHFWAEGFQDCICLLFFIFIGNKMMIR